MIKFINIIKIGFKLLILAIGILGVWFDWMFTSFLPINIYLLSFYALVMAVCLIAFVLTFFAKIRKISYIIFFCSFGGYVALNFIPEIKDKFSIDACLDAGHGVWDYNEHRCRTDCWHWSKETGCEKIETE